MDPRTFRSRARRAAPFALLLTLLCVMGPIGTAISAETVQAWRKRLDGAGLTVGINPLNPNTIVAEAALGSISISYDRGTTWHAWSSPETPFIRQIIIHPADTMTVFCVTANAFVRSTDYGATWTSLIPGFGIDGESVTYDPVHPDTMFAGNFGDGNIFRSLNRGATWSLRGTTGPPGTANLCALAIRPDSTNILFAGAGGGRISKSTDFGATWRLVKTGTAPLGTFQETPRIVIPPLAPHIAYATTYGDVDSTLDVWKSVDGGEHWFRTGLRKTPSWSLECDPTDANTVYAGSFSNALAGVYKTTDGGSSWSVISSGMPAGGFMWNMKIHPLDPSLVWMSVTIGAFGPNGLYRLLSTTTIVKGVLLDAASSDTLARGSLRLLSSGATASVTSAAREFRFGYFDGDPSLSTTLHAEAYPYALKDVPVTFIPDTAIEVNIALQKLATHAIGGTLVDSVTLEPVHALVELFVKRSVGDTVLTDSTDPGGAFQFPQQYLSAPPVNSYDRLVFDVPPPYAGAVISPVTLAGADLSYQVQLKHADVFLIAASDSGKYLSYYQTALDAVHATFNTWDLARKGPAPLGLAPSFGLRTVIAYTGDLAAPLPGGLADSLVACLDAGGHLFLTGQNVAEYNAASALFTSYLGVGFAGNTPLAYCQGFAGESLQGFNFFTTGSGANNQMSRDSLHALRPDVHPILEYGVNTGRVAGVRVDSAGAGNAIVLGFGFEAIHTAAKRQALLQYVFDWSVATAVTSGEEPFLPASAFLEQNYPNPFNPNTTIRFRVPAAAHATLRVYDLNGREVAALLDRRVEPGAHSVVWSAAGFASGVYYCRLTVSDGGNGAAPFTETRKLLLLQ